jgi:hypothetical protein
MRIGWFLIRCTPSSFVQERDEESKLESAQIAGLDPNTLVDHVPIDIPDVMQNFSGSLSMNVELTASLEGDGSSICVEKVRGNGDFGPVMSCIPSNDHLAHSAQSESMVVLLPSANTSMRLQVYNLQAQIQTLLWIMFPWTLRT